TIIVFVETGFVAHRVNQELSVPLSVSRRPTYFASGPSAFADTASSEDFDAGAVVKAIMASLDDAPDGLFAGDERNWRRRRTFDRFGDADQISGVMLDISWPSLVRT